MNGLIEPNLHPVFVHFAVGLLFTAAIALAAAAFAPASARWRDSLRIGGDWMLGLGLLALIAAVIVGFDAYYSVAHDGPSHAAMTTHRNWALATAAAFVGLGLWRWAARSTTSPSLPFALALLIGAVLLTTTAWWGGRLVFQHGLGVESLPQVSGEGHDHAHDGAAHDHAQTETPAAPGSPAAVADAFADALAAGDEAAVRRLLAPDVLILEGGGAERSLEEYASHHMGADMAFMQAVEAKQLARTARTLGDTAWVATDTALTGRFRDQDVAVKSQETLVLRRAQDGWRIVHIHWSNNPLGDEEPAASTEIEGDDAEHDEHDHEH